MPPLATTTTAAARGDVYAIATRTIVLNNLAMPTENCVFVDSLVQEFKAEVVAALKAFDRSQPTVATLFLIVPRMMATLEKVSDLRSRGMEKKDIVLTALKSIITAGLPEYAPLLVPLIDPVIGPLIDASCVAAEALASKVKETKCWKRFCLPLSSSSKGPSTSCPTATVSPASPVIVQASA